MPDPITIQPLSTEDALRRQLERGVSEAGTFALAPGTRYGLVLMRMDRDAEMARIAQAASDMAGVQEAFPVGDHTTIDAVPAGMQLEATVKVRVRGKRTPPLEPEIVD